MRTAFETEAGRGPADVAALARAARTGDAEAGRSLAAAFAHVAFARPEATAELWDRAVAGWRGGPLAAAPAAPTPRPGPPPEPIAPALWEAWWALVEDAGARRLDALSITARTAALAAHLPASFMARVAAACLAFPGVRAAAEGGIPPRFTLAALALAPEGSLGHAFYRQIVENGYELEVLDRDSLGLETLPFPLPYLNARMLQLHDLWHLSAGYELTALHEIGISGFQLGQFGHHYSAMFLALIATTAALALVPGGAGIVLEVMLGAYAHGRESPPLLGLPWEELWHEPVEAVRARIGLVPFASPYPANLFEALAEAA